MKENEIQMGSKDKVLHFKTNFTKLKPLSKRKI